MRSAPASRVIVRAAHLRETLQLMLHGLPSALARPELAPVPCAHDGRGRSLPLQQCAARWRDCDDRCDGCPVGRDRSWRYSELTGIVTPAGPPSGVGPEARLEIAYGEDGGAEGEGGRDNDCDGDGEGEGDEDIGRDIGVPATAQQTDISTKATDIWADIGEGEGAEGDNDCDGEELEGAMESVSAAPAAETTTATTTTKRKLCKHKGCKLPARPRANGQPGRQPDFCEEHTPRSSRREQQAREARATEAEGEGTAAATEEQPTQGEGEGEGQTPEQDLVEARQELAALLVGTEHDLVGEVLAAGRILAIQLERTGDAATKEDLVPWAKACGRLSRDLPALRAQLAETEKLRSRLADAESRAADALEAQAIAEARAEEAERQAADRDELAAKVRILLPDAERLALRYQGEAADLQRQLAIAQGEADGYRAECERLRGGQMAHTAEGAAGVAGLPPVRMLPLGYALEAWREIEQARRVEGRV